MFFMHRERSYELSGEVLDRSVGEAELLQQPRRVEYDSAANGSVEAGFVILNHGFSSIADDGGARGNQTVRQSAHRQRFAQSSLVVPRHLIQKDLAEFAEKQSRALKAEHFRPFLPFLRIVRNGAPAPPPHAEGAPQLLLEEKSNDTDRTACAAAWGYRLR